MSKNDYIEQLLSLAALPYVIWRDGENKGQDDEEIPFSIYEKMADFYQTLDYTDLLNGGEICQVESAFGLCDLLIPGDGIIYVAGPYLKERGTTADFFFQLINNDLPISYELNLFYHTLPVLDEKKLNTLVQLLCRELNLLDMCNIKQEKTRPTENHLHSQMFLWVNAEEALTVLMAAEGKLFSSMELANPDLIAEAEVHFRDTVQQMEYRFELQYLKEHLQISNSTYQRLCSVKSNQYNSIDTLYYEFRKQIQELDSQEAAFVLQQKMIESYSQLICNHAYEEYPVLIQRTLRYLNEHWRQKPSLDNIAEALSINKTYLSSQFNRVTGRSISQYLNELKVNWAEILLKSTSLSISDISYLCGFDDASYFAKVYKKWKGHTAQECRTGVLEKDLTNEK